MFIALDALYKAGERTGEVNVPQFVQNMRNSRMNMIKGEVCLGFQNRKKTRLFFKLKSKTPVVLMNVYLLGDFGYVILCIDVTH